MKHLLDVWGFKVILLFIFTQYLQFIGIYERL